MCWCMCVCMLVYVCKCVGVCVLVHVSLCVCVCVCVSLQYITVAFNNSYAIGSMSRNICQLCTTAYNTC